MQHAPQMKKSILVADSDAVFQRTLTRALEKRGHKVIAASTLAEARSAIVREGCSFLISDIRFPDGNGFDLLEDVRHQNRNGRSAIERVVVLTSYGNVAGAVTATKLGAADFLAKPSDADTIEAAILGSAGPAVDRIFARPDEIEFRYLLTIFEQYDRNMSETARAIGMHRRTLQRILRRRGIAPAPKAVLDQRDQQLRMRRLYRLWTHLLREDKIPEASQLDRDAVS